MKYPKYVEGDCLHQISSGDTYEIADVDRIHYLFVMSFKGAEYVGLGLIDSIDSDDDYQKVSCD